MRIFRVALAYDEMMIYDHLQTALDKLNKNYVGSARLEIKRAIKIMQNKRPSLKGR